MTPLPPPPLSPLDFPLPTLETERLILRPFEKEDLYDFHRIARAPEVTRHLVWNPHTTLDQTRRHLDGILDGYRREEMAVWALVLKDEEVVIGDAGFMSWRPRDATAEIGYLLGEEWWGKGYAAEAMRLLLDFGWQVLGLRRIEARSLTGNDRSIRMLQRLGFEREGLLRGALKINGERRDVVVMGVAATPVSAER